MARLPLVRLAVAEAVGSPTLPPSHPPTLLRAMLADWDDCADVAADIQRTLVPDAPVMIGDEATIAIGVDDCAWCRMRIDEERLAAQFVAYDGRASSFGEAGCLLAWMAANPGVAGMPFVRTRDAAGWRPAGMARYVTGAARTPMRFDVTAFAGDPPAGEGDSTESWDELRRKGAPRARQG